MFPRKAVLAEAQAPLAVEDIPQLLDTWDMDFEQGHRRSCTERDSSPRACREARRAERCDPREPQGREDYFEIASPELWQQGLFAFHRIPHLHVTYTIEQPRWVNVFVIARTPARTGNMSATTFSTTTSSSRGRGSGGPSASRWRSSGAPERTATPRQSR
jgi:hypothetical protein